MLAELNQRLTPIQTLHRQTAAGAPAALNGALPPLATVGQGHAPSDSHDDQFLAPGLHSNPQLDILGERSSWERRIV